MHGLIRRQVITDAARHDGGQLREGLIARTNTSRSVWADSAYRSAENEAWLDARGMVSRIHRKKPRGRPMPKRTRRANAAIRRVDQDATGATIKMRTRRRGWIAGRA